LLLASFALGEAGFFKSMKFLNIPGLTSLEVENSRERFGRNALPPVEVSS
jgi:hypothetical protein